MLVNLGCGSRYHPAWLNFDIAPATAEVLEWDASRRLPLADDSVAAVYHSHLLEHLRVDAVPAFLNECFRVLKPGGILRVVVPDLERIAREYLTQLEAARGGEPLASGRYDWMMLELFDQTVRERPGGRMLTYLQQPGLEDPDFVIGRLGEEAARLMAGSRAGSPRDAGARAPVRGILREALQKLAQRTRQGVPGTTGSAISIGRFRLSGEVHQWMYDRYSLARVLTESGFVEPSVTSADRSQIADWATYQLDAGENGVPRKPDSMFMEARKPWR